MASKIYGLYDGFVLGCAGAATLAAAACFHCGSGRRATGSAAAKAATVEPMDDPEELARLYRQNGYVRLPKLLSADEVEVWRAAVARGAAAQLERSGGAYHATDAEIDVASGDYANQGADAGHYRSVFVQCVNMWKKSAEIKALLFDCLAPRLRGLLATVAGCDAGYKLYHDHCLIKQPCKLTDNPPSLCDVCGPAEGCVRPWLRCMQQRERSK